MFTKEKESTRIAVTFAGVVENGVGMQQLGKERAPIKPETLRRAQTILKREYGIESTLYNLNDNLLPSKGTFPQPDLKDNLLLHVPRFLQGILSDPRKADDLFELVNSVTWDRQKLNPRTKKVCNSHARENNCFADIRQDADIPSGRGTVVPFTETGNLQRVREIIGVILGDSYQRLNAEGNKYATKSVLNGEKKPTPKGIGWHGDVERNIVVCLSLGMQMNLHFAWYHKYKQIDGQQPFMITVKHGDLYIMGEGTSGKNWKSSSKTTLRHAAGNNNKYVQPPKPKKLKKPQKRKRSQSSPKSARKTRPTTKQSTQDPVLRHHQQTFKGKSIERLIKAGIIGRIEPPSDDDDDELSVSSSDISLSDVEDDKDNPPNVYKVHSPNENSKDKDKSSYRAIIDLT